MDRLKLDSHAKVARGVEPRAGPFASKIGVIMTDESIITVGSFLFRFCGLIARAFTRTLMLNPWLWESDDYTPAAGLELLRGAPEQFKWLKGVRMASSRVMELVNKTLVPVLANMPSGQIASVRKLREKVQTATQLIS